MAETSWQWRVTIDRSACEFAFFVSHVSEDGDEVGRFAASLNDAFVAAGGLPIRTCFLDIQDWEHGNPPKAVIRRNLAASHFFLGWVTPNYLKAGKRGWVWHELAYAELVELSRQASVEIEAPFIVPVFRNVTARQLQRTPWLDYMQRELERSPRGETIEQHLPRLVPRLIAYYEREMRKWTYGT
jgi:hypothetical protein